MSESQVTAPTPPTPETVEEKYFPPEAISILRRLRESGAELPDDETILLIAAGQAALTKYIDPHNQAAQKMLELILVILDHREVNDLTLRKLLELLRDQRQTSLPSGQTMRRMSGRS